MKPSVRCGPDHPSQRVGTLNLVSVPNEEIDAEVENKLWLCAVTLRVLIKTASSTPRNICAIQRNTPPPGDTPRPPRRNAHHPHLARPRRHGRPRMGQERQEVDPAWSGHSAVSSSATSRSGPYSTASSTGSATTSSSASSPVSSQSTCGRLRLPVPFRHRTRQGRGSGAARPALGAGTDQGSHPHAAGRQRRPQLSVLSRQPVHHCPILPRGSTPGRREGGAVIEVTTRPDAGQERVLKLLECNAKMQRGGGM